MEAHDKWSTDLGVSSNKSSLRGPKLAGKLQIGWKLAGSLTRFTRQDGYSWKEESKNLFMVPRSLNFDIGQ